MDARRANIQRQGLGNSAKQKASPSLENSPILFQPTKTLVKSTKQGDIYKFSHDERDSCCRIV